MEPNRDPLDFTGNAVRAMLETVDSRFFRDKDAELIYRTLISRLHAVPFCAYLKRYIYRRAGLSGDYSEIPLSEYDMILRASFSDNETPPAFTPTTAKLSALSKNWLTQYSVKRNVVLLLGFGLGMSLADVNSFLTVALREAELNPRDPFEMLCRYCYQNSLGYPQFVRLQQKYADACSLLDANRKAIPDSPDEIRTEDRLLRYLASLHEPSGLPCRNAAIQRHFRALYDTTRDLIAGINNITEEEKEHLRLEAYRDRMANNDHLYNYTKQKRIEQKKRGIHRFSREDITPSDIEHILCSAIPTDKHGNLLPIRNSRLNEHFRGRKFSRQHLSDILNGQSEADRFDLITLNFFIYSQKADDFTGSRLLYRAFTDATNAILEDCGMGCLYAANPYECFLLMCILSDDPLGTYADVWEMAYETE